MRFDESSVTSNLSFSPAKLDSVSGVIPLGQPASVFQGPSSIVQQADKDEKDDIRDELRNLQSAVRAVRSAVSSQNVAPPLRQTAWR